MTAMTCKACKKLIAKNTKIICLRKKQGQRIVEVIEYYHEECFEKLTEKRKTNEHSNKKRAIQK